MSTERDENCDWRAKYKKLIDEMDRFGQLLDSVTAIPVVPTNAPRMTGAEIMLLADAVRRMRKAAAKLKAVDIPSTPDRLATQPTGAPGS